MFYLPDFFQYRRFFLEITREKYAKNVFRIKLF